VPIVIRREHILNAISARLPDRQHVVVSNREPYLHKRTRRGIVVERPPGGLVAALDPVLQATGGVWIAWGSGSADREVTDRQDHVWVPPEEPRYVLRRVWLPPAIVERYYYGYANQALWPLCHMAVDKARFLHRYWDGYVEANHIFAAATAEEAQSGAFVWVQDYHLALFPRFIRARRPDLILVHFWHIPWPAWDVFRACPQAQRRALLEGLLGSDLLGFHVDRYRRNFLECVTRELEEAEVDPVRGLVDYAGRRTTVRTFPISIDVDAFDTLARSRAAVRWMARWRRRPEIGDRRIAVGVDRLDYTKGIPERLRAIDRFLAGRPEYAERFVFVQKAAPSRTRIQAYRELQNEVERLVGEINTRRGRAGWQPILYVPEPMPPVALAALYRMAEAAIVSPLQDGMNLVAKEFIAAQVDGRGVLLLSELAGAAEEMAHAVSINPYDEEGFAEAISQALAMPAEERRLRMRALRAYLAEHDIYWWMEEVVAAAGRLIARREETRHLFEEWPRLEAQRGGRSLVLFLDYDGTLVPIAPTPDAAAAAPEVRAVLRGLQAAGCEVVIVSGRSTAAVRALLGLDDLVYMGNHGLEVHGGEQPPVREAAERARGHIRELSDAIRRTLGGTPGLILEHKDLSASVHYRLVDPAAVPGVRQAVAALAESHRPWVTLERGKEVLEFRPSLPWDKGRAVLWWLETRYGAQWAERVLPIYCGDDRTDEDAFGALAGRGITVAVGPEGPTAAAYSLRDPSEVLSFLRRLSVPRPTQMLPIS
jgi:alpha,alpha-trehalose-phosphate synthase [UDP-forming]/trehalose-phosphatase